MVSTNTPRSLAWELLRRVFVDGAYANLAWDGLLSECTLSREEKAFATHLAYGTLRHSGTLDRIIEFAAGRNQDTVDPEVWWVVRLGAFQWLWMRTPAHAVVNESVKLAKKIGHHPASGLVNAVLRKISAVDLAQWLDQITEGLGNTTERLGIRHAHPTWVVDALAAAVSDNGDAAAPDDVEAEVEALLIANNEPTTPTLALLPGLTRSTSSDTPTRYSPWGVLAQSGGPGNDPRVRNGQARVQDEGSQLAALVLANFAPLTVGEEVADICSGPGGKAALIQAQIGKTGARLTAIEKAPHRALLVETALAPFSSRTPPPRVVTGAAGDILAAEGLAYDRILLDAPCTGLGALRRRPESRWRKNREELPGLLALQRNLLEVAWAHTRPGGVIVYVTCSPLVDETTDQMAWLAANFLVTMLDTPAILDEITSRPLAGHRRGSAVQLWPHRHQTDAMFIQAIRRDG